MQFVISNDEWNDADEQDKPSLNQKFYSDNDIYDFYAARRRKLCASIGKGILILRSSAGYNGGRHEFRVSNNFFYLTGLSEPNCILILDSRKEKNYSLSIRKRSMRDIVYNGDAYDMEKLRNEYLPDYLSSYDDEEQCIKDNINLDCPIFFENTDIQTKSILEDYCEMNNKSGLLNDVSPIISEQRVFKDKLEISYIKNAIDITGEAFINACIHAHPEVKENIIEAEIESVFMKKGAKMPAFRSIVASTPNNTILHYEANNNTLEDVDLLLMDIGAEYNCYASDISRTIPVGRKFTDEQREIYELILKAQEAAIEVMKPGNYITQAHHQAAEVICNGLYDLGLITDLMADWQRKFYILYPCCHFLGLDVHDVGDYGETMAVLKQNLVNPKVTGRRLEAGMILTVEPGLYLREKGMQQLFDLYGSEVEHHIIEEFIQKVTPTYNKYKNIGIRIEDDILITPKGNINLSIDIPKQTNDIEKLMIS
ncbi:MAG: Xaa-Pro aminopeptidase [Bacteroidales bacterium]|nr:Xaa-Pro aminopeptidase [Bacteroidales bacterium]